MAALEVTMLQPLARPFIRPTLLALKSFLCFPVKREGRPLERNNSISSVFDLIPVRAARTMNNIRTVFGNQSMDVRDGKKFV